MHIINFSYDNYCELELAKGNKVEVIGHMETEGKNIFYIKMIHNIDYLIL